MRRWPTVAGPVRRSARQVTTTSQVWLSIGGTVADAPTTYDVVILGRRERRLRLRPASRRARAQRRHSSRRTRSGAPACTAAASRPRRCCTRARSPTPCASPASSACRRRSKESTSRPSTRTRTASSAGCTRACRAWSPAARSPSSPATGCLSAPHAVEVDGHPLRRSPRRTRLRLVLAQSLPGLERRRDRVLTSEHALELTTLPAKAHRARRRSHRCRVRVGMALVRRRRDDHRGAAPGCVPAEDEACSKALERAFRKRGITFTHRHPVRLGREDRTPASTVTVESGDTYDADLLLVAVGRGPRTADLGYEDAGHRHGPRLRAHRRAAAHERRRRLRRRRHRARACSWPTGASSRASSSPRTSPA